MQDLDLLATNFGLRLSSSCHSSLWRQAACDAGLLERWRVQDYSLLLCMQWVPGRPAPAVTPQASGAVSLQLLLLPCHGMAPTAAARLRSKPDEVSSMGACVLHT